MLCPISGNEVPGRMVSSLGRVKNQAGRIHSGCIRGGYLGARYTPSSGFGSRIEFVHRLVAFTFLGPPATPQQSHVNHRDGNKQNNAAANLEHVTPAENIAHYWKNRTPRPEGKGMSGSKPVWSRAYTSNDNWTWHPSTTCAAKVLGLRSSLVSRCVHGKQLQTGGHEFRAAHVFQPIAGEEWRKVDVDALLEEKRKRAQARWTKAAS